MDRDLRNLHDDEANRAADNVKRKEIAQEESKPAKSRKTRHDEGIS